MRRRGIPLPVYASGQDPCAGSAKQAEADDPMSLEAMAVPGESMDVMAEAWVEEFARLGTSEQEILGLFRRPFFRGTHAYFAAHGEAATEAMIRRVLARTGVYRYSEGGTDA